MDAAAENGHVELVKWLYNKSGIISDNAIQRAAKNYHLDIVKYMVSENNKIKAELATKSVRRAARRAAKIIEDESKKSFCIII